MKIPRNKSIDTIKFLSIIAVISLHIPTWDIIRIDDTDFFSLPHLADKSARFAVPFFFIISGYYWGIKIDSNLQVYSVTSGTIKKIGFAFFAWCIIYLMPFNFYTIYNYGILEELKWSYWNILSYSQHLDVVFFRGTSYHLWFLMSLLQSVIIAALLIRLQQILLLIIISVVLFIVHVLSNAYVDTPIGIHVPFDTGWGPFVSNLFFVTGYFIAKTHNHSLRKGVLLFIIGYALMFLEAYFVGIHYGTPFKKIIGFGTYFVGVGLAYIGLSDPKLLRIPVLSTIGQMTLGIFAIHMLFIINLKHSFQEASYLTLLFRFIFSVLALSVIAVYLMSKNKILKKIVI